MFGEIVVFGVYLPKLLALAILALAIHAVGKKYLPG